VSSATEQFLKMTQKTEEKLNELPAVARNINLPCKKCNCDRYHIVVAHTTATSAKVRCEVCGSTKTFRLKKVTESSKKSAIAKLTASVGRAKRTVGKRTVGPDPAALWGELRTQIGTANLVPYEMRSKYSLANAINHPKFGVGFVTSATKDKIDVAFEGGGRSLVHNRT
jgi:hypothetical protein